MLFLKYMLLVSGILMVGMAAAILANDAWLGFQYHRKTNLGAVAVQPQPIRWRTTLALACLAWAPILLAISIAVSADLSSAQHHAHASLVAARTH